jgi:hypothetical protein
MWHQSGTWSYGDANNPTSSYACRDTSHTRPNTLILFSGGLVEAAYGPTACACVGGQMRFSQICKFVFRECSRCPVLELCLTSCIYASKISRISKISPSDRLKSAKASADRRSALGTWREPLNNTRAVG